MGPVNPGETAAILRHFLLNREVVFLGAFSRTQSIQDRGFLEFEQAVAHH